MIAHIKVHEKSFGDLRLYNDLEFRIAAGEKLGLLGRNGTGKSTLFAMITKDDSDYDGSIDLRKGLVVISARQEHQDVADMTVLDYIQSDLPEHSELKHKIDTLPDRMEGNERLIQQYSDALERFGILGYYQVEDDVLQALETYQLSEEKARGPLGALSGGQKRFVELVKVQRARADLALIDEPTNHMDYVAKEAFIQWLKSTKEAVVVISHDRDVLNAVDRIIELRDGKADICRGNYDAYLKTNTSRITSEVNEYSVTQSRITNLESDVLRFQRLKEKARNPGTIQRFKNQEQRARAELKALQAQEKPSFWIDKESAGTLKTSLAEAYDEHKARNIRINTSTKEVGTNRLLIDIQSLSLGYTDPLFSNVNLQLREGDKLRIHGRNGVGKSTFVQTMLATVLGDKLPATVFEGSIELENTVRIGVYEQELQQELLKLTIGQAIEAAYRSKGLDCSDQLIRSLLGDYLFNPNVDVDKPLSVLSGGQKARYQLISMLAGDPNVLILDEPTNHLDLPSIEELEQALGQYHGAVVYISHDSYFTNKLRGATLNLPNEG